jgi:hypothetical protein
MKLLKQCGLILCCAIVAACGGGGGNAGTAPFGNGSSSNSTAADLILTVGAAQIPNTGSSTLPITATAIDASRNTMASVPITINADSDAVVSASSTTTDASGNVSATLSIGANRSNRVITITATSGSISKSTTVQVVGTKISSTLVPAVIAPSTAGQVQYRVVDQAGSPMSNQDVQITATGLTPASATGTTGANGDYVFNYTSPATAGSVQIVANIAGASDVQTVQVQSASTVPTVTTTIESASVSANPSVVGVNLLDSAANRSEIRALFLGANNLPIPNVRVRFDLNGDPASIGGTFTTGTQTLYSDANGVVTTSYVPGTRSSPTNGVTVRACYGTSDADPNLINCTTFVTQTLTVTSEPLNVTIGTNALIIVNTLTYVKQFNISVVDSAGAAKPDVNIVASIDLPTYRKGSYAFNGTVWVKTGGLASGDTAVCANEDVNRNGVLEAGEDTNGNGSLEPRKADVRVSLLSSKTDSTGSAVLQVIYDQDHASWVDAAITVAASGVSGTEGRATYYLTPVPVDTVSLKNKDVPPAYVVSPYGVASACTNPN